MFDYNSQILRPSFPQGRDDNLYPWSTGKHPTHPQWLATSGTVTYFEWLCLVMSIVCSQSLPRVTYMVSLDHICIIQRGELNHKPLRSVGCELSRHCEEPGPKDKLRPPNEAIALFSFVWREHPQIMLILTHQISEADTLKKTKTCLPLCIRCPFKANWETRITSYMKQLADMTATS